MVSYNILWYTIVYCILSYIMVHSSILWYIIVGYGCKEYPQASVEGQAGYLGSRVGLKAFGNRGRFVI